MIRTRGLLTIIMALLITAATGAAAWAGSHTGTVTEAVTGGGYTYMNINENGKNFWIAGPQSPIGKGTTVTFDEQVWMINFESKALARTFPQLLFVSGVSATTAAAPAAPAASFAKVRTIDEIMAKKDELKGGAVSVHGKVVKVSKNIMGRNWIHMVDGSESGERLIFRSIAGSAEVGSTITATGRLETDVDFGFGYFYPVIVEDASFSK